MDAGIDQDPQATRVAQTSLTVDGRSRTVTADTRTSLLDALRDHLGVTAAKKGCDHGQCGACTVLLDGRRIVSCLTFVVAHQGAEVRTAAGLADGDHLHPMQEAFIDDDGFQCGFCTPGQICSAVGMLAELHDGAPSHVTTELNQPPELSQDEIAERMSGNLCRCGAYVGIRAAIEKVARS